TPNWPSPRHTIGINEHSSEIDEATPVIERCALVIGKPTLVPERASLRIEPSSLRPIPSSLFIRSRACHPACSYLYIVSLTATSCRAVRARRVSFSPPPRHVARTASPFPVRYGTARLPTQCLLRQAARHQGRSRRWVIADNHARSRETARPRVAAARGSGGLHKRGGRLGPPEARWRRSRATGHLRRTSLARRGMHPSRQRSRSRDRAWRWADGRRTSARRGTALRR